MLRWLKGRADPISTWSAALSAALSIASGAIGFSSGYPTLTAVLGISGGVLAALGVWTTGIASKQRDDMLQAAVDQAIRANQRLDYGDRQF